MNILLLPSGPIKVIQDATRAAKRTMGLMVTANTLEHIVGITWDGSHRIYR